MQTGCTRARTYYFEFATVPKGIGILAQGKENRPILATQRRPRLRLEPKSYAVLRQRVLQRDGWRCQRCGSLQNLEVHHLRSRSRLGDDAEENLITLCNPCHRGLHSASSSLR